MPIKTLLWCEAIERGNSARLRTRCGVNGPPWLTHGNQPAANRALPLVERSAFQASDWWRRGFVIPIIRGSIPRTRHHHHRLLDCKTSLTFRWIPPNPDHGVPISGRLGGWRGCRRRVWHSYKFHRCMSSSVAPSSNFLVGDSSRPPSVGWRWLRWHSCRTKLESVSIEHLARSLRALSAAFHDKPNWDLYDMRGGPFVK